MEFELQKEYSIMNDSLYVICKLTNLCNLKCSYCFIDKSSKEYMDFSILREIIINSISFCIENNKKELSFAWHGGEPLLFKTELFAYIVYLQRTFDKQLNIRNLIQTNGSHLNVKNYNELVGLGYKIGISYDAFHSIQKKQRPAIKSQLNKIIHKNIKQINRINPNLSINIVGTREVLNNIKNIYYEQNKKGISFKLMPLSPTLRVKKNSLLYDAKLFSKAIITLFDIWIGDSKRNISITNIDIILKNLYSKNIHECTYMQNCQSKFICFEPNGDAYPCSRFSGIKKYHFGNIKNGMESILCNKKRTDFRERHNKILKCQTCRFLNICSGGCVYNAYANKHDIFEIDYYCEAIYSIYDYIEKKINNLKEKSIEITKAIQF